MTIRIPGRNGLALGLVTGALVIGGAAVALGRGGGDAPSRQGAAATQPHAGMAGMQVSSDGSVQLTPEQIREFGVTFGTVEERPLEAEVRTVGIVAPDERRIAQVAPKFSGFVERLYVDFTGRPVTRGEPLIEVYSPELVSAQEELLVAARLDAGLDRSSVPGVEGGSSHLLAAARRRLSLWDISDAQIDAILRTGRVRRTMTLYAPASGIVMEKPVVRGQAVQAGQTLYTIADLSSVWVEAELREGDAAGVTPGALASVELAAYPGRPIAGRVEYVYPTLQAEARTLKARVEVANPDLQLKPGMYANVRLSAPARTALTVPSSAVVQTGERNIVFVDHGHGRLMPHEVVIGRVAGDYTELLSGVEPGRRVVTSAQFLLDSESNLAETMKAMAGMSGSSMKEQMPGTETGQAEGMGARGADMRGMDMPAGHR
ncbi:MAG TPA: efflux RND transporter periplasmic adaptor subunit [Longimicrobiaceae bacterium]